MKRTIRIRSGDVYYGNKNIGYLTEGIRERFGLRAGKYIITIVEGTQFGFAEHKYVVTGFCALYEKNERVGILCARRFSRLFFEPDGRKRYDITVKKVRPNQ